MVLNLKNSSATWLHYFDHHLYVLTYHGDLVRFNLRHLPASQQELFNVKDLSQLPWSRFRFEDLIVEAAKAGVGRFPWWSRHFGYKFE